MRLALCDPGASFLLVLSLSKEFLVPSCFCPPVPSFVAGLSAASCQLLFPMLYALCALFYAIGLKSPALNLDEQYIGQCQ